MRREVIGFANEVNSASGGRPCRAAQAQPSVRSLHAGRSTGSLTREPSEAEARAGGGCAATMTTTAAASGTILSALRSALSGATCGPADPVRAETEPRPSRDRAETRCGAHCAARQRDRAIRPAIDGVETLPGYPAIVKARYSARAVGVPRVRCACRSGDPCGRHRSRISPEWLRRGIHVRPRLPVVVRDAPRRAVNVSTVRGTAPQPARPADTFGTTVRHHTLAVRGTGRAGPVPCGGRRGPVGAWPEIRATAERPWDCRGRGRRRSESDPHPARRARPAPPRLGAPGREPLGGGCCAREIGSGARTPRRASGPAVACVAGVRGLRLTGVCTALGWSFRRGIR